jgi:hypothetical protein
VFSYIDLAPGGSDCRQKSPVENQSRGAYASVDISAGPFTDKAQLFVREFPVQEFFFFFFQIYSFHFQ